MPSNINDSRIKTELARERNREASARTFMSWIRTSLALIGFGFGVGRVHHYMEIAFPGKNLDAVRNTRLYGGAFLLLGAFCLVGAAIQHWQVLKRIEQREFKYSHGWPFSESVAAIALLIGLIALFELLF